MPHEGAGAAGRSPRSVGTTPLTEGSTGRAAASWSIRRRSSTPGRPRASSLSIGALGGGERRDDLLPLLLFRRRRLPEAHQHLDGPPSGACADGLVSRDRRRRGRRSHHAVKGSGAGSPLMLLAHGRRRDGTSPGRGRGEITSSAVHALAAVSGTKGRCASPSSPRRCNGPWQVQRGLVSVLTVARRRGRSRIRHGRRRGMGTDCPVHKGR
jgi:hypothetical protein